MNNSLVYTIAATQLKGLGPRRIREIIATIGDLSLLFTAPLSELNKLPIIGPLFKDEQLRREAIERAERELDYMAQHQITPFVYTDDNYPFRLKQCDDAPIVLYVKGNIAFNSKHYLAIVGTRHMTPYGKALTEKMVTDLAQMHPHVAIVSGLAYGVDITAHRSAMENGLPTIAVVAHGLEKIYPSTHTAAAQEILEKGGAVVTEYISGSLMDPANFIQRNRIIAGLSDASLIVESAQQGGALFTAFAAQEYNRDVFAFPGRSGDTYSVGCNRLIRDNKASLIESAEDLIKAMSWSKSEQKATQQQLFVELTPQEKLIVEKLYTAPMHINHLSQLLGMPIGKSLAFLTQMEFKGLIQSVPGSMYQLAP